MAKTTEYLWQRPGTSHYWFSRAVPKSIREVEGGKRVIQFSLGTSNRAEARRMARREAERLDSKWGIGVGAAIPAGARNADDVALFGFDRMMQKLEDSRRTWPRDDNEYSALLDKRQAELRLLTRRLNDGDLDDWRQIADRTITRRGLPIIKGTVEYDKLVQEIAESTIDALGVFVRRNQGDLDAAPKSAAVQNAKLAAASKAKSGETILELFERWAADMLAKGDKRQDTINQDRKVIQQFAEFVGEGRAIRSITALDVVDYRDRLRELPPRWRSIKALRGLSMRDAAARARVLGLAETAFTTVNKHLSTISPLYAWLAKHPAWAGLVNPCNGLFHAKVKGKNRRPPFSTEALNKILKSPLYTGFLGNGKEHLPGNMRANDWRFWIPLIAMFTGARIGEIAQLRVGDVRQERGVWFIHIRHDEGEGLATKSGKSRPAAVHSGLEQIGFLAFHAARAEEVADDPKTPLFPELNPNKRGQISGVPSRWWRDYLADIGVKDDTVQGGDGFGAHSFRHTLADRLRSEAELLDDQIEVALGHNQKTTTSGYGELSQGTVTMFKGWMDGVRFDGVDFSHLVNANP